MWGGSRWHSQWDLPVGWVWSVREGGWLKANASLHVFGVWVIGGALARWGETREEQGLEGWGWEMGTFRHANFTMPLR